MTPLEALALVLAAAPSGRERYPLTLVADAFGDALWAAVLAGDDDLARRGFAVVEGWAADPALVHLVVASVLPAAPARPGRERARALLGPATRAALEVTARSYDLEDLR